MLSAGDPWKPDCQTEPITTSSSLKVSKQPHGDVLYAFRVRYTVNEDDC